MKPFGFMLRWLDVRMQKAARKEIAAFHAEREIRILSDRGFTGRA